MELNNCADIPMLMQYNAGNRKSAFCVDCDSHFSAYFINTVPKATIPTGNLNSVFRLKTSFLQVQSMKAGLDNGTPKSQPHLTVRLNQIQVFVLFISSPII